MKVKLFLSAAAMMIAIVAVLTALQSRQSPAIAGDTTAWRSPDEQRTIDVYKRTNDAVVFISTVTLTVDPFDWFPEIKPQKGSGSGIIIDAVQGLILTNLHVIQNAQKIEILLANGQSADARLVGADQEYDVAVLRLTKPVKNLKAIEFGDSSILAVGQAVLAIGNPFGLYRTLTTGIISSLDRTVRSPSNSLMRGLIQTDAAINPGNSGGPLLDNDGRLIAINTAILSTTGDSAGIGFAVPINHIKRILPDLIRTGKVRRLQVGWVLVDTTQGPMVRRVISGSAAEQAGIQPIERMVESVFVRGYVRDFRRADLIVAVNGQRVTTTEDVEQVISGSKPEDRIRLTLRRGGLHGAERSVEIKPVLE